MAELESVKLELRKETMPVFMRNLRTCKSKQLVSEISAQINEWIHSLHFCQPSPEFIEDNDYVKTVLMVQNVKNFFLTTECLMDEATGMLLTLTDAEV